MFPRKLWRRRASSRRINLQLMKGGAAASSAALNASSVERLLQIAVHAGGPASRVVALEDVRGQRDDRRAMGRFLIADATSGFQPVEIRHLHVHQDHVVVAVRRGSDGGVAAGCLVGTKTQLVEHQAKHTAVRLVVFDDEDRQARRIECTPAHVGRFDRGCAGALARHNSS